MLAYSTVATVIETPKHRLIHRCYSSVTQLKQKGQFKEIFAKHHTNKYLAQTVSPQYFPSELARYQHFSGLVEHNQNTTSMFTVTTLTHKTADTRHPVIMLTNREGFRYFFGKVPEGTQRVLNENKFKLGKLKSVFFTGTLTSWSEIGGLPGLFLTLSDATKKGIDVFSNSSEIFSYIVATWRCFVFRKGVELKVNATEEEGLIGDNNLSVKCVKITPAVPVNNSAAVNSVVPTTLGRQLSKLATLMFPLDTSKVNSRDPASYKWDPTETEIQTHVSLPNPTALLGVRDQQSINYIIRFLPVRGKFDPKKAKELNLIPNVHYKILSMGDSVTNKDGVIVHPDQVLAPSQTFPRVLILDIPNLAYLENTINSEAWFQEDGEEIGMVYHLLDDSIDFETESYQNFILKFPIGTKHVISHSKIADNTVVFRRMAANLLTLKTVQRDNFNLPVLDEYVPLEKENFYKLHQLQQFHISTKGIEYDNTLIDKSTWSSIYDEHVAKLDIPGAIKSDILNAAPIPLTIEPEIPLKDQVHVITLGTGSAIPSLQRNVISQLVRVPLRNSDGEISIRSALLDGGENTLGTILRNFSHAEQAQLTQIFQELSLIHLSHLHADHHLGLVSVINKWFEVNTDDKKLYLILPWQYDRFIKEWYNLESNFNDKVDVKRLVYLSCEEFLQDRRPEYQAVEMDEFETRYDCLDLSRVIPKEKLQPRNEELINQMFEELQISEIKTVRALHCAWAYSISIKFNVTDDSTFKVSYSGDTRPNPKFVDIGYGSDLLLHESSLDNELIEEAIAKKHSTMIEAINVSKFMNCPKVILTHFSTRYSNKNDISTDEARLVNLSKELNDYLVKYRSPPNIFTLEKSTKQHKNFKDMDICFAFDMMNIKYSDVGCQKSCQDVISRVFAEEDLIDEPLKDEKKEKELLKKEEKREAKRLQRLSMKYSNKKRKESPERELPHVRDGRTE